VGLEVFRKAADHHCYEGAMPAKHFLTTLQDPANEGAYMYQSDVVVAGFKGTTCFAKDFYLSAYQACGEPKGAVPKSAQSGVATAHA
jgi:hypothetical protein